MSPVGRSRFECKLFSGDALRHNNGSTVLGIPKRLQNVRQTQAVVRGRRQFVEELRRRRVGQRDCAVHITDNGSIRKLLHPIRDKRSEEHTSELQSLMRISYAVFCLKKKKHIKIST